MEKELYRIYAGAVDFIKSTRKQRVLWSIRFPSSHQLPSGIGTAFLRFNPASMEDATDDDRFNMDELRKCFVGLIITLALFKRGKMNGELFDKEAALALALVVPTGFI
jgi:hypothetical protein